MVNIPTVFTCGLLLGFLPGYLLGFFGHSGLGRFGFHLGTGRGFGSHFAMGGGGRGFGFRR